MKRIKSILFGSWVWLKQASGLIVLAAFIIIGVLIALSYYEPIDHCIPNLKQLGTMAAVVTVLSIVFVIATLKQQQSLFEAQILNEYNQEYMDKEMLNFVRILGNIASRDGAKYGDLRTPDYNPYNVPDFKEDDSYQWTVEEDNARRKVKGYFIDVLDLYLEGKISRDIFHRIVNKSALPLLFKVVEPMEWYLNDEYDYRKFYKIMLLASDIYEEQKRTDKNFRKKKKIKRVKDSKKGNVTSAAPIGKGQSVQAACVNENIESGNTCSEAWKRKVDFGHPEGDSGHCSVSGKIDINLTW